MFFRTIFARPGERVDSSIISRTDQNMVRDKLSHDQMCSVDGRKKIFVDR